MTPAYKRYALVVMATVYTCNLLDRWLMALLLQPIKEDLQLSDTQLGFLTGIAFALFYAVVGVPIARWADRGNRVNITASAIGLWGLMVMSCLFVTNYAQLVGARIAAAVGESGCKPPTLSMLGDYFPQVAERTRAMAVYWLGAPVAMLISYSAGGWLNERYGWRLTFFLMGIPGLVLAILVKWTLAEPRSDSVSASVKRHPTPPMMVVLSTLWHQRSIRNLSLALIMCFAMIFGLGSWNGALVMRSYNIGSAELGVWLGAVNSIGMLVAVVLGAYVANRWFAGNEQGLMRMSAIAIALSLPFYVAFLMLDNKHLALMMLIPWWILSNLFVAPVYTLIQRLVVDEMRATAMAIIMLLYNLVGMGLGPQVVGILSDLFKPVFGMDSLRYAVLVVCLVALWSAYYFWQVGKTVKEDLASIMNAQQLTRNLYGGNGQLQAAAR